MVLCVQWSFLLTSHCSLFTSDPQFILSFISSPRILLEKNQSLLSEFSFVFYQKFFPQQALNIKRSACQTRRHLRVDRLWNHNNLDSSLRFLYDWRGTDTAKCFLCNTSFGACPLRGAVHPCLLYDSFKLRRFAAFVIIGSFKCTLFSFDFSPIYPLGSSADSFCTSFTDHLSLQGPALCQIHKAPRHAIYFSVIHGVFCLEILCKSFAWFS